MEKIEKTIHYVNLFSSYKGLLSSTQKEILEAYFCFDLSLSEIAEDREVSRAAIEDALRKGCKKLEELEGELHLVENKEEILKITAKLKEKASNNEDFKDLEEIERRLG
ncbi:MAG: DNA-binding protein [Bacilli bacterium]|nr:DNA-binding protein [Bacilli bacterium]